MRYLRIFPSDSGKNQHRMSRHLHLFFAGVLLLVPMLICGCSHNDGFQAKAAFIEANDFFSQGNYTASLGRYQQVMEKEPSAGDRALFEMGIIHAYPGNEHKDYQRSLECFRKLIKDYPGSSYRKDSELMVFNITNVIIKDTTIATQQAQIEALRQEAQSRGNEIITLQKKIEALEQEGKGKENEIATLKKEVFAL